LENVEDFLFLYLVNDLGASQLLCGITITITVIFELPVFHYSSKLLNKIGVSGMIIIAQVSHITRVFVYTLLTPDTVWYVCCVEPLHGFTFACMWSASVHYAATISPKGLEATTQGILAGVYFGLGAGTGGLVGGFIYENLGAVMLYRIGVGLVSGVLLLYIISILCLPVPANTKELLINEEDSKELAIIN